MLQQRLSRTRSDDDDENRGAVLQWLARPLVTPAARVRSPDQAHY